LAGVRETDNKAWASTREVRASIAISVLVLLYSVLSLAAGEWVYPDPFLSETFRPNDAVNLIIGIPALFLGLQWRRHLAGFLLWTAALLFYTYNSLVALMSFPAGWQMLLHLLIVLVSAGIAIRLLARTDNAAIFQRLEAKVAEVWTGGALTLFGLAFAGRAVASLFFSGTDAQSTPQTETALLITDTLFGLAWAAAGIALAFRRTISYAIAGAGLIQAALLFVALNVFLIIEPAFVTSPRMAEDLVATLVMTLLFAVPVGIFIRGVTQSE
jgi:hypothetical protein